MENEVKEKEPVDVVSTGAFITSLKRNNKQIRDDRGTAIGEIAELTYRRKIQDMELDIKQLTRKRDNMLDLSPTNAMSLMVADEFDATKFVAEDIAILTDRRNLQIKIDLAKESYKELFGKEYHN